ncbi:hypothetical protein XA68_17140 [Ophiocordyceps unilateralis]|uniref:GRIP domain-containing protein n=1 Tax=Ophiocordyceps unilateralis TaxID=268505 RepID=A0A2A9P591_OPHUN|nr:hypothetical protein XA68_17140 [Ophiocordyceps unilateralis]
MFQRIKGAIDRTIAEEQARQKSLAEGAPTSRPRSGSSRRNDSSPKRLRAKRAPSVDASDAAANPDPAVFEAAFVIDDSDDMSRAASPRPPLPSKDNGPVKEASGESDRRAVEDQDANEKGSRGDNDPDREAADSPAPTAAAAPGLTPDIKQRLRKLEKLEATYPELLRSYRVAHKRATAIEPFEKALRDNSPLVSISDPEALIEYLNQLNLRGDMVMQELKRVTADRDELKRKQQEAQVESTEEAKGAEEDEDDVPQLKADLAAKTAEMDRLTTRIIDLEKELLSGEEKNAELQAELAKANTAKSISKKLIEDLQNQMTALQKDRTEAQGKMDELSKKLESQPPSAAPPAQQAGGASKKKGKKKKAKGGAVAATAAEEVSEPAANSSPVQDVEADMAKLKDEIVERDSQIERLSKQRKTEEDLREEIETLQENLINIGQDHVEAKEKIKALEGERASLIKQVTELEAKMGDSSSTDATVQKDLDGLREEYKELQSKSKRLQSDLGATEQLAQTRFKDLTELREVLQKAQPELKALRQESAALKTAREELTAKAKELKEAELKERDLKRDVSRLQQLSTDREAERLKAEGASRQLAEEAKRLAERRAEADKIELSSKAEQLERELQKAQAEVGKLRPRVRELEEQLHKAKRERAAAQEEADFKAQQYSNAQALLGSMRDQTAEISTQLKEARSQAESVEEELVEVRRLLQERTSEGETMRRLLAEVDERANSRIREMKERMETAVEERERMEEEASVRARGNARETEALKHKVRHLERSVQTLTTARDQLSRREEEWKVRKEEVEAMEAKAEESLATASQLRKALDASEKQLRDEEEQRGQLRRMLDEARQRYDSLVVVVRETKRTSMESSRSLAAAAPPADMLYLKTILLQFLEQKDGRLRAQLVPVLGKLLNFDK